MLWIHSRLEFLVILKGKSNIRRGVFSICRCLAVDFKRKTLMHFDSVFQLTSCWISDEFFRELLKARIISLVKYFTFHFSFMSCQITYLIINSFSNFTPTLYNEKKRKYKRAYSEETDSLKRFVIKTESSLPAVEVICRNPLP